MLRYAALRQRAQVVLLLSILAVAGCTNFFYDKLDTLARWYIQDLVSLDSDQRSDVHAWLENTLQWHRQSELTRYSQYLRELSTTVARPGTAESYRAIEAQVEEFGTRLVERALPDAARLLMSLSPQQLQEFDTNLADKARERNEENIEALAAGKWHDKRAKDIEKQLKRWTGAVTKEQQALIRQASARFDPTTTDWMESQARWRQALFAALNARFTAGESPATVEERILRLMRTPESQWTSAYQAKAKQNREQSLVVIGALDQSLTAAQRSFLQAELNKQAKQLEGLAKS